MLNDGEFGRVDSRCLKQDSWNVPVRLLSGKYMVTCVAYVYAPRDKKPRRLAK